MGTAPCCALHCTALQDYNQQVLRKLTIPNVLANMRRLPPARQRPVAKYWAGSYPTATNQPCRHAGMPYAAGHVCPLRSAGAMAAITDH